MNLEGRRAMVAWLAEQFEKVAELADDEGMRALCIVVREYADALLAAPPGCRASWTMGQVPYLAEKLHTAFGPGLADPSLREAFLVAWRRHAGVANVGSP
jgi:hypothetical protein